MGSLKLLLVVVVWALCRGVIVVADIRLGGPYVIDLEEFSPCHDVGSLGIEVNVRYVQKYCRIAYNGNLTFPYRQDDEELLTAVDFERWGSTGGWSYHGTMKRKDIMTFLIKNFPNVFRSIYGSMGITGKPMPADTYQMVNFKPEGLKLEKLPQLPYGRYRLMAKQSKDDIALGCLQFIVNVLEVA